MIKTEKIKYFIYLHLCILVFTMTEVLGKFAAIELNTSGFRSVKLYALLFGMLCVCAFYAFCWQKIIKHFDLHIAYANRSVYLVWSQVWAYTIFSEQLTARNILGMLIVLAGVVIVSLGESKEEV